MSVLGNLVRCQREYGVEIGENGRLVDRENKPLFLRYDATPMTRSCLRPIIDLITKMFDFFLKCFGWPSIEEEHVLGISERGGKELSDKIAQYGNRVLSAGEENLLREETEALEKVTRAATTLRLRGIGS